MAELLKSPTKKRIRSADLVQLIIDGIEEKKGIDIVCINLKKIPNSSSDYFVICEGNSNTQVQAIAGSIEETVKKKTGQRPWHVEGTQNGEWILIDYIDVVAHVFQPESRKFYNLEDMWADAEISNGRSSEKSKNEIKSKANTKAKAKTKSKKKIKAKVKTKPKAKAKSKPAKKSTKKKKKK